MASTDKELRREIGEEREKLTEAVATLRTEIGEATDVSRKLRSNLPIATAGALGFGFLASGGLGATVRLLMRRGRDGEPKAKVGRFSLIDRD